MTGFRSCWWQLANNSSSCDYYACRRSLHNASGNNHYSIALAILIQSVIGNAIAGMVLAIVRTFKKGETE
ncbi:MAG: hypothetical protein M3299_00685 [Thermoproteota archaeon]|nr:hypothetical protein [Thermoproteota archaeon]